MKMKKETRLAVVGLGYVGLPLAVHFGAKYQTVGFDLKQSIVDNSLAHKRSHRGGVKAGL